MQVELLDKLSDHSNLLKGAKGIVEEIIPDQRDDTSAWAPPGSTGNSTRGWARLQHFPRVMVRFAREHNVGGIVPGFGNSDLVAIGASCQKIFGRPQPWKFTWIDTEANAPVGARARTVKSSMVSFNLPLRPMFASTTTGAQGQSTQWYSVYPYPLGMQSFQEWQ